MKIINNIRAVANTKIDFPMTREKYLSSWKIFRSVSHENYITAQHILSLSSWNNIHSVLDIGCGDGLVLNSIIELYGKEIKNVYLVDPDEQMLEEAYLYTNQNKRVQSVEKYLSNFENQIDKLIYQVDIALAVHLVYLIPSTSFKLLINSLPVGKRLIIILDSEESIFTQLWRKTAEKYVQRSIFVRTFLNDLGSNYSINKSAIISKLANPYIQKEEVKQALLSLMSYSDYSAMSPETKQFVHNCIYENLDNEKILCKSLCYEIIKLK